MNDKYILVDKKPIVENDLIKWEKWFEKANRHVGKTKINGVEISTVFLSFNHRFGFGKKPILFETMVFGGKLSGEQERYCTWEQAEKGHKRWVKKVEDQP